MPIAYNDDSGEALFLDQSGTWKPAKIAENPDTGERVAFDGTDWKPIGVKAVPEKPQSASDMGYGANDAIAHGLSFGITEEVGALGGAVGDGLAAAIKSGDQGWNFRQSFDENLKRRAAAREQFAKENPKLATALEIGGGLMTGSSLLSAGKAAVTQGAKAAPKIFKNRAADFATKGAAIGAVAGTAENNENRLQGAATGGAIGLAAGGVTPWAVNVASKYGRPVTDALFRRWGGEGPKTYAQRKVLEDLMRQDLTPDQAIAKIEAMGPRAMGADLATELAETVAQAPGKARNMAKNALYGRQKGMHQRVTQATNEGLGVQGNYNEALPKLYAARKAKSAGAYEKAYAVPVERLETPEIKSLMKNPQVIDAWADAQEIAGISGRNLPEMFVRRPDGTIHARPNMEALDYVKKALDDRVSMAYRNGRSTLGTELRGLRDRLRDALDAANPDYAAARAIYAGDSAMIESMESGRAFMRGDAEDVLSTISKLSDAERVAFREGVAREIRKMAERPGDHIDVAKRIFSSPDTRNRLKSLFPDQKVFQIWSRRMQSEIDMAATKQQVLGGSPTARRLDNLNELGIDPAMLLGMTQNPAMATPGLLNQFGRWAARPPEKVRNQIAEMLMNPDQKVTVDFLRQLNQHQRALDLNRTAASAILGGAVSGNAGLLAP